MNGIDISAHQDDIDLSKISCDFVIVKATEGADYFNRCFNDHANKTLKLGRLFGMYHYANGGDARKEAEFFLSKVKKFIGKGIIALDWEGYNNPGFGRDDLAWCEAWCSYVYRQTGIKPFVYVQKSAMNRIKLAGYPLWVAQYPDNNNTGFQKTPWNEGKYDCAIRQYTSHGRIKGYNGDLDLNKAYISKATWQKYAGVKPTIVSSIKITPTTMPSTKRSIVVIAKEVIAGKWDNGDARKVKLAKAGYDYNKVQAEVNKQMKASRIKSTDVIAQEVIAGKWGNGEERKTKLKKAGYDPDKIQKRVNEMLQ